MNHPKITSNSKHQDLKMRQRDGGIVSKMTAITQTVGMINPTGITE